MDNANPQPGFFTTHKSLFIYVVLLLVGAGIGVLVMKTQSNSQSTQTVTVTGNGTIEVPANQAVIYAKTSIISTNKEKATSDNIKITQDLKKALLDSGVSGDEINIATYVDPVYSSYPDYKPVPTGSDSGTLNPSTTTGEYNANSTFTITLNDLNIANKVKEVIENTPKAELNGNPSYLLKDPTKYESQAREKALLDARSQADKIAQINNVKVGKVLSITDEKSTSQKGTGAYYPPPYSKTYADYGEKIVRVTASYTVKYELKNNLLPF